MLDGDFGLLQKVVVESGDVAVYVECGGYECEAEL